MALSISYPDLSAHPDFDNHEKVLLAQDPDIGFKAYIAIHNTQFGSARGGCRYWSRYASENEAIRDVLRLSRGMTFKNTLAGLEHGGGKTVIVGPEGSAGPTPEMMRALGHALNELGGIYETGEDVGTSPEAFAIAATVTPWVRVKTGEDFDALGLAGGDPCPYTAFGIFSGMQAAVKHKLGKNGMRGVRVAVKGLGNVAQPLCELLHKAGAELIVADIDPAKTAMAAEKWGASIVAADRIIAQEADIYAPCALGGDINADTIDLLQAKIVAGAANNQLADISFAQKLHERGILYAPDYAINAGGVINVVLVGQPAGEVMDRVGMIGDTLGHIFKRSEQENRNTADVADTLVLERLAESYRASQLKACA